MGSDGPTEPRPAATVIAARRGANGVEVLVLKRGSEHRFLPGYLAFPGGAVEPQDGGLASRWFGSSAESGRACAVRELIEEAGLALTAAGLVTVGGDDLGRLIGKGGRVANAIRTVAKAASTRAERRVLVEFVED